MPYALVMGASGDIGQAVCEKLAGQGWSLYCHYNQQKEKVLNFVSDLQKRYPQQDFFYGILRHVEGNRSSELS